MSSPAPDWVTAFQRRLLAAHEPRTLWIAYQDERGNTVTFPLVEERIRLGRASDAGIRLDHPEVDRQHAVIVRHGAEEPSVSLIDGREDAERFAPPSVNGVSVDTVELSHEDEIGIGPYRLWFIDLRTAIGARGSDDVVGFEMRSEVVLRPEWQERIGPLVSADEILYQGGGVMTATRLASETLLELDDGSGVPRYPAFQFHPDTRKPYAVLASIIPFFREAAIDVYTAAVWFQTPQPLLNGLTPATWLAEGRDSESLVLASRRTIARLGQ